MGESWDAAERLEERERLEAHERRNGVGLAVLLAGLAVGGSALASIALALDRPGVAPIADWQWWGVVVGGLLTAWSAPWFLRPTGRRRMAIVLVVASVGVLAGAWLAIKRLVA